ncbi:MAG: acyl-CoA thioesterase-2 [Cognaticolwellia sp.]|jgi:acyl-CoA thioesterase-2|tara:strand:- start:846 stop:1703 length:858 start_codon:yes stop_codon:yes gene_type:complete
MKDVSELLEHLKLERLEENLYRGTSKDVGSKSVFGGQVLAQALQAASATVSEDRIAHSLHGYFILPGDINSPIVFNVDRVRDGGSFTTRRVAAIQHGKTIFSFMASFQKKQEGFDHQIEMPNVAKPEDLYSDRELFAKAETMMPEKLKKVLGRDRPIIFKPTVIPNFFNPQKEAPFSNIWFKANGEMPDDLALHQSVLAYASDYNLLTTALKPHGISYGTKNLQMASIDHAMWFFRDFRVDDWLLYAVDSPSTSNARGFCRGNIFNQDGILVASVVQEGLIRKKK